MALEKTMTSRKLVAGGQLIEQGKWFLNGVTSGNIVPEAATFTPSSIAFPVTIAEIEDFSVASDNDVSIVSNLEPMSISPKTVLRIISVAGTTGNYTLIGRPA